MGLLSELLPLMKNGETARFRRRSIVKSVVLEVTAHDVLVFDKASHDFKLERTYQMEEDSFIEHDINHADDWTRCG